MVRSQGIASQYFSGLFLFSHQNMFIARYLLCAKLRIRKIPSEIFLSSVL